MLKDGYEDVLGDYMPVQIDPYLDNDGNEIIINPCPKCVCKDQEVVVDNIYDPSCYRLICANEGCGYSIPEEITDFEYFHDDGVLAAINTWNFHTGLEDLIKSGDYTPSADEDDSR